MNDTTDIVPAKKTPRQKVFALLPTLLTLGNAVCGFGAITILARVGPDLNTVSGNASLAATTMESAAHLIFLAMLFDALDGSAARLTNQTSEFGAMLDSLCDVVSFGVAPAFMMLKLSDPRNRLMEMLNVLPYEYSIDVLWAIAALFMACAILRLARFNVETDEDDDHGGFSGLPSPAAAAVIAAFPVGIMSLKKKLDLVEPGDSHWAQPVSEILLPAFAIVIPIATLATAVLMVSRIHYPHVFNQILKGSKGRKQFLQLVFTLALIFVLGGLTVPVIVCWFAFAGPAQAVWKKYQRKRAARRAKTEAAG